MVENSKHFAKSASEDQIDISILLNFIWKDRFLISAITIFVSISITAFSFFIPNTYSSSALLAPSDPNESLTSKLGSYSALAGMAGVTFPDQMGDSSVEAIERISSFDFFSNHFLPNINLEDLMAVKRWMPEENNLIYDNKDFDPINKKWVRKVSFPYSQKPSNQEAYDAYLNILTVNQDNLTKYVTVSIEHKSPFIAKDWVEMIVLNINESMREREKRNASNSIVFLKNNLQETNLNEIKDVISQLLETQMRTLMLASANKDYIFKTVDSPLVEEKKTSPQRAFIAITSIFIGFILSILISFIRLSRKS